MDKKITKRDFINEIRKQLAALGIGKCESMELNITVARQQVTCGGKTYQNETRVKSASRDGLVIEWYTDGKRKDTSGAYPYADKNVDYGTVMNVSHTLRDMLAKGQQAQASEAPVTDEQEIGASDDIKVGDRVLCRLLGVLATVDHYGYDTELGERTYIVKHDKPLQMLDGTEFEYQEYSRYGLTTNYDPQTGRELIGNAQHYRETLVAPWFAAGEAREFELAGVRLSFVPVNDGTTDFHATTHHQDGTSTTDRMTLTDCAEWLARLYTEDITLPEPPAEVIIDETPTLQQDGEITAASGTEGVLLMMCDDEPQDIYVSREAAVWDLHRHVHNTLVGCCGGVIESESETRYVVSFPKKGCREVCEIVTLDPTAPRHREAYEAQRDLYGLPALPTLETSSEITVAPEWAKVGQICRYGDSHSVVEILELMNEHKGALVKFRDCLLQDPPFFLSYKYMSPYELPAWCKVGARVRRNHPYYTRLNGVEGRIIEKYGDWAFRVEWDVEICGEPFRERDVWHFDMEPVAEQEHPVAA